MYDTRDFRVTFPFFPPFSSTLNNNLGLYYLSIQLMLHVLLGVFLAMLSYEAWYGLWLSSCGDKARRHACKILLKVLLRC